ncbi:MAG: hypothetical protein QW228_04770 [Candidatus Aenigmatarchaeota archaeon]
MEGNKIVKKDEGIFIPSKLQRKFLRWFVEEFNPQEIDKVDLTMLALKGGFSPLKVRKWFKDERFKQWFYEEVDEIFKLYARILAKQMLINAIRGNDKSSERERMFLVKLFLEPPRVYKHEYKSYQVNINQQKIEKDDLYTDFEIIKPEKNDGEQNNMVSE